MARCSGAGSSCKVVLSSFSSSAHRSPKRWRYAAISATSAGSSGDSPRSRRASSAGRSAARRAIARMRRAGSADTMPPWPIMNSAWNASPAGPAQRPSTRRDRLNAAMQTRSLTSGASHWPSSRASIRRYSAASAVSGMASAGPPVDASTAATRASKRRTRRGRRTASTTSRSPVNPSCVIAPTRRSPRAGGRSSRSARASGRGRANAHRLLHRAPVQREARQQRQGAIPVQQVAIDPPLNAPEQVFRAGPRGRCAATRAAETPSRRSRVP